MYYVMLAWPFYIFNSDEQFSLSYSHNVFHLVLHVSITKIGHLENSQGTRPDCT